MFVFVTLGGLCTLAFVGLVVVPICLGCVLSMASLCVFILVGLPCTLITLVGCVVLDLCKDIGIVEDVEKYEEMLDKLPNMKNISVWFDKNWCQQEKTKDE
jgi:hypothetical protein